MNNRVRLWFLLIFSSTITANKKIKESCTTSNDKQNERCVPIKECQFIYNAIASQNKTILDTAKQFHCREDEDTLVCCENPGPIIPIDPKVHVLPNTTICGRIKDKPRLWGGQLAEIGEFPWIAGLEYKHRVTGEKLSMQCIGTLINEEFVLTTAECLLLRELELITVRLGEWDTTTDPDCIELIASKFCGEPTVHAEVGEIIPHPFYNRGSAFNNIGLIRFKNKIQFSDFIQPICLTSSTMPAAEVGERLISAGWGINENVTGVNILSKVELPIASRDSCIIKYNRAIGLHQLCVGGEDKKGFCLGDHGTPLMKICNDENWYQYGIGSFGLICGTQGYPSVYTKISDYFDWITFVIFHYREHN